MSLCLLSKTPLIASFSSSQQILLKENLLLPSPPPPLSETTCRLEECLLSSLFLFHSLEFLWLNHQLINILKETNTTRDTMPGVPSFLSPISIGDGWERRLFCFFVCLFGHRHCFRLNPKVNWLFFYCFVCWFCHL